MSKQKPEVLLLAESPFGAYDAERYGLDGTDEVLDMTVADLTPLIKPDFWRTFGSSNSIDSRVHRISTMEEFRALLAVHSFDVAIDEIGVSSTARRARREVLDRAIPRVRLRLGLLPGDFLIQKKLRDRWIARRSQLGLMRLVRNIVLLIPRRFMNKIPRPDLVLGSGSFTRQDVPNGVPIIWAHSFDFEKSRRRDQTEGQREASGAVFLDQNLGYHSDQAHSALRSPIDPSLYYPRLRAAFSAVEEADFDVVVALHPKASGVDVRLLFGERPLVSGATQRLVRDARVVLCHASASLSYAVIWRKPVLFLTSRELERSWYHSHIHGMAELLRRPILDIDQLESYSSTELQELLEAPVDETAYASYEERFIRSNESQSGELWRIFAQGVSHFLSERR